MNDTVSTSSPETFHFQAEVQQVLDLVVHSLYSKKEIFLRELISNASDALDKLRFESLKHPTWMAGDAALQIKLEADPSNRTLTISDNGIGMTRSEVIDHLGTIAQSGTRAFLSQLAENQATDVNLIGQFGVGFYSVFMVADRVEVITRHASSPAEQASHWVSGGKAEFTLETVTKSERGTDIILHLKPAEDEFLDAYRLKHIVHTYSEHLSFPILMKKEIEKKEDETVAVESEWEAINRATALWTLPKKDITDTQYAEFYKQIAHDFEDPLIWNHARTEGKSEYTSLIYIPKRAAHNAFFKEQKNGLKLYIQRVFILDEVEYFLPGYLRFVRGVIDSQDLPLNVSREILQHNDKVESIKSGLTKKVLGLLEKLSENKESYQKFWSQWGRVFKEGVSEDRTNYDRIVKLLRFVSTESKTTDDLLTLDEYVERMKPVQENIYYLIADQWQTALDNPHLEWFRQKGIEVLIFHDRIDEWLINQLSDYEGKKWCAINKADLDWKSMDQNHETPVLTEQDDALIQRLKELLKDDVADVRASEQLVDSPCCISTKENDWSVQMQKWMRSVGESVPEQKPILEINLSHPLVNALKTLEDEQAWSEWARFFLSAAYLAETGQLATPMAFLKPLYRWLSHE